MSSNETDIALAGDDFAIQPAGMDTAALDRLAQRNFLPYVKLVGATSAEGKTGKARMGNFILITGKDAYVDLTNSFECLVFARRPRACRKTLVGLQSYFDMHADEYKKVVAEADAKKMGSWYGTEFLIWLRLQEQFATYHAGSPTARGNSVDLVNVLKNWDDSRKAAALAKKEGKAIPPIKNPQITFRSALLKGQGQEYWGPQFVPSTTPFSKLPQMEEVKEQATKFCAPIKGPVVETVEASVEDRG
jgi:hypothetical protein